MTLLKLLPFQGGASVVVYAICPCSSAFCCSLTFVILWRKARWLSTGKELFTKLSAIAVFFFFFFFFFLPSKMCVLLSRLVSRVGYGIRLYRFLIMLIYFKKLAEAIPNESFRLQDILPLVVSSLVDLPLWMFTNYDLCPKQTYRICGEVFLVEGDQQYHQQTTLSPW